MFGDKNGFGNSQIYGFQESLHKTDFYGSKNLGLQNPMGFLMVFVGRPENGKVEKWKLTRLPMSFKRTGDARFLRICWEICGFAMYGDAGKMLKSFAAEPHIMKPDFLQKTATS